MVALPSGDTRGAAGAPRRKLSGRFSAGHLVMVVAGLLGMVLGIAALRHEPDGVEVAVAAHEIRAGDAVTAADFRSARVQTTSEPARHVRTDAPTFPVFAAASPPRRLHPASRSFVVSCCRVPRMQACRAMSIPIDPSRAVGGHLATGDRVDVLFAGDHQVSIIVRDAEVLAVDAKGRGGIGETSSPFTVTIAVDAPQSQLLAAAIADGDIVDRPHDGRPVVGRAPRPQPLDRVGASGRHRAVGHVRGTHHRAGLLARTLGRDPAPPSHRPRRRTCAPDRARAGAGTRGRVRHAGRQPSLARSDAAVRRSGAPSRARCVLGVFDPDEPAGREHLARARRRRHDPLRRGGLRVRRGHRRRSRRSRLAATR